MEYTKELNIEEGRAICYSGFREGQYPGGVYPSYEEVLEDLLILQKNWKYLRLYDCDKFSETVLKVIQKEKLENVKNILSEFSKGDFMIDMGRLIDKDELGNMKSYITEIKLAMNSMSADSDEDITKAATNLRNMLANVSGQLENTAEKMGYDLSGMVEDLDTVLGKINSDTVRTQAEIYASYKEVMKITQMSDQMFTSTTRNQSTVIALTFENVLKHADLVTEEGRKKAVQYLHELLKKGGKEVQDDILNQAGNQKKILKQMGRKNQYRHQRPYQRTVYNTGGRVRDMDLHTKKTGRPGTGP